MSVNTAKRRSTTVFLHFTRAQVGHGGRQLQVGGVVRGHANLDGARPLVHHLVDAHLEHLVGAEGPAAQDHAMVEVVRRTTAAEKKTGVAHNNDYASALFMHQVTASRLS